MLRLSAEDASVVSVEPGHTPTHPRPKRTTRAHASAHALTRTAPQKCTHTDAHDLASADPRTHTRTHARPHTTPNCTRAQLFHPPARARARARATDARARLQVGFPTHSLGRRLDMRGQAWRPTTRTSSRAGSSRRSTAAPALRRRCGGGEPRAQSWLRCGQGGAQSRCRCGRGAPMQMRACVRVCVRACVCVRVRAVQRMCAGAEGAAGVSGCEAAV